VVDEKTGKVIWREWLGDPLIEPSRPSPRAAFLWPILRDNTRAEKPGHRLLAADLKTGKHIWEQEITADVISAPIVSEGVFI